MPYFNILLLYMLFHIYYLFIYSYILFHIYEREKENMCVRTSLLNTVRTINHCAIYIHKHTYTQTRTHGLMNRELNGYCEIQKPLEFICKYLQRNVLLLL